MKNSIRKFQLILLALASVVIFASCNKDEDPAPAASMNIVQTAVSDSQFSILTEALTKAGLVSALEGDGPFTVFAPTNDAFNTLFSDLGISGIDDLSAETLVPILLNHVVIGKVMAADVTTGYVSTLNNTAPNQNNVMLYTDISNGVTVDGSKVIAADVLASNGVIHAIDKVILPASVVNLAIYNANFSTLVQAVVKANLVDALNAAGPYTVFAPTNAAFDALFSALNVGGIDDLTAEQLSPILLYHVVSGNVVASQVSSGMVPTLNGKDLTVVADASGVTIDNTSNVIVTDVQGSNGVIHVIDSVLLP